MLGSGSWVATLLRSLVLETSFCALAHFAEPLLLRKDLVLAPSGAAMKNPRARRGLFMAPAAGLEPAT